MLRNIWLGLMLVAAAITVPSLSGRFDQAAACACCGTFKVTGVASNDQLNIRKGPGTRYQVIDGIPAASACVIKTGKRRGKWAEITYAGSKGWVHSRYLRFFKGP